MIFMTHEQHGATHAYTTAEALALSKNGWKIDEQDEPETEEVKRPPGRPKKVE